MTDPSYRLEARASAAGRRFPSGGGDSSPGTAAAGAPLVWVAGGVGAAARGIRTNTCGRGITYRTCSRTWLSGRLRFFFSFLFGGLRWDVLSPVPSACCWPLFLCRCWCLGTDSSTGGQEYTPAIPHVSFASWPQQNKIVGLCGRRKRIEVFNHTTEQATVPSSAVASKLVERMFFWRTRMVGSINDVTRHDMTCHGMIRYGMTWHDMT